MVDPGALFRFFSGRTVRAFGVPGGGPDGGTGIGPVFSYLCLDPGVGDIDLLELFFRPGLGIRALGKLVRVPASHLCLVGAFGRGLIRLWIQPQYVEACL